MAEQDPDEVEIELSEAAEEGLSNLLVRHDMRVNLNPASLPANPPVSPTGLTNPATPAKPTP